MPRCLWPGFPELPASGLSFAEAINRSLSMFCLELIFSWGSPSVKMVDSTIPNSGPASSFSSLPYSYSNLT